jgi:2-C-methyl-D-erythritol 4-phosphate cytidylyltransferase/2-C-methyl-D-erythritol 2,4-cyclodiphosphate synthase
MTAPQPWTAALIVAAGDGARAGPGVPKQFRRLAGRVLLDWSVRGFIAHPAIDYVGLVLPPGGGYHDWYEPPESPKLGPVVAGGPTRQASVLNGLAALAEVSPGRVLIHDGARPLVSHALIDRVLAALDEAPGAIPALPVRDTLKRAAKARVVTTIDRSELYAVQTPQGFDFSAILGAHRRFAGRDMTDDAAIAQAAGLGIALVEGEARNMKITGPEDFALAEALMRQDDQETSRITVSGTGFDVHRIVPGDGLILCGVKIAAPFSLLGHSDADCGLHALTDAVLGAIGAGDIGVHFPPTNDRWKGAASDQFLAHAVKLVAAVGGSLINADVTLICERPKIGPHRDAMRARIAQISGLPPERVSVKATTTEGLGFAGRGEGIAAQAIVSVSLPAAPATRSTSAL